MTNKLFDLNIKLKGDLKAHDPALVKENDKWWLFHTGKGVGVKSSADLKNWKKEESILDKPLIWWSDYVENFDRENDVWAPDLEYFNGRWWLYYSVSEFGTNNSLIGLLSADSIEEGNWKDEGLVITSAAGKEYNTIDPNLFIDPEGKPWLVFGSWFDGIKLVKIDSKTMKTKGEIYSLARRSVHGRAAGVEAPSLTYRDGYYYLFTSIDHCCRGRKSDYKIAYGRSKNIKGPYVDKNNLSLLNGGGTILTAGDEKYIGHGGQDLYNNSQLVHHAYHRKNGEYRFFIKKLDWKDGWPTLNYKDQYFKGFYKLKSSAVNKVAAVSEAKTEARTKIIVEKDTNRLSQQWLIYPIDSKYYRLENRNSLLYAEVKDAQHTENARIGQWSHSAHPCQQWQIVSISENEYKLVNQYSKKALTVNQNNELIQQTYTGKKEQHWQFEWLENE
ncbi:MAG: family 43 glycosylhydrolase [Halanaerobium sp.]